MVLLLGIGDEDVVVELVAEQVDQRFVFVYLLRRVLYQSHYLQDVVVVRPQEKQQLRHRVIRVRKRLLRVVRQRKLNQVRRTSVDLVDVLKRLTRLQLLRVVTAVRQLQCVVVGLLLLFN